jgi:hypothetical protein
MKASIIRSIKTLPDQNKTSIVLVPLARPLMADRNVSIDHHDTKAIQRAAEGVGSPLSLYK